MIHVIANKFQQLGQLFRTNALIRIVPVFLLTIAIGGTVLLAQQQQDIRQHAAGDPWDGVNTSANLMVSTSTVVVSAYQTLYLGVLNKTTLGLQFKNDFDFLESKLNSFEYSLTGFNNSINTPQFLSYINQNPPQQEKLNNVKQFLQQVSADDKLIQGQLQELSDIYTLNGKIPSQSIPDVQQQLAKIGSEMQDMQSQIGQIQALAMVIPGRPTFPTNTPVPYQAPNNTTGATLVSVSIPNDLQCVGVDERSFNDTNGYAQQGGRSANLHPNADGSEGGPNNGAWPHLTQTSGGCVKTWCDNSGNVYANFSWQPGYNAGIAQNNYTLNLWLANNQKGSFSLGKVLTQSVKFGNKATVGGHVVVADIANGFGERGWPFTYFNLSTCPAPTLTPTPKPTATPTPTLGPTCDDVEPTVTVEPRCYGSTSFANFSFSTTNGVTYTLKYGTGQTTITGTGNVVSVQLPAYGETSFSYNTNLIAYVTHTENSCIKKTSFITASCKQQ